MQQDCQNPRSIFCTKFIFRSIYFTNIKLFDFYLLNNLVCIIIMFYICGIENETNIKYYESYFKSK